MPMPYPNPIFRRIWDYWSQKNSSGKPAPGNALDEPVSFGRMLGKEGEEISLKSVSISGVIEGLLYSSRITQTYKNETGKALEIIYTFPVGYKTALLGLEARIGEKWLIGEVIAKKAAEERYEKAISTGDAAIMVQEASPGLYTANLGNIRPGETVEVMIHCAQMLSFDQGRVRVCIPTVIGERYGDPHSQGGLAPHESAAIDPQARYELKMQLTVRGEMARGRIQSPTHAVIVQKQEGEARIELAREARLDRDFVLLLEGICSSSHACAIQDNGQWMAAASFEPEIEDSEQTAVCLKILVDCSGSMGGGSIEQARRGLAQVLRELQPGDYISYSRFGSNIKHLTRDMQPCTPETLERFARTIDNTHANMGGTQMEAALASALELPSPDCANAGYGLLLITDGDVWDVKKIIDTARRSGQRIFAIGVGAAPAESLLKSLAEETGGSCEFVTPNENMAEAIVRMLRRMRGGIARNITIDWQERPVWQTKAPACLYGGETIHAFALFESQPELPPVLRWQIRNRVYQAEPGGIEESCDVDLLRLGGRAMMEEADNRSRKLGLALKYQLVSDLSSLILVHERPEGEKTTSLPKIQQVPQMPAYGHGSPAAAFVLGSAALNFVSRPRFFDDSWEMPCFLRGQDDSAGNGRAPKSSGPMPQTPKAPHRKKAPKPKCPVMVPARLLEIWRFRLLQHQTLAELLRKSLPDTGLGGIPAYVSKLAKELSLAEEIVWAVLIAWELERQGELDRHSRRLLSTLVVAEEDRTRLIERFTRELE